MNSHLHIGLINTWHSIESSPLSPPTGPNRHVGSLLQTCDFGTTPSWPGLVSVNEVRYRCSLLSSDLNSCERSFFQRYPVGCIVMSLPARLLMLVRSSVTLDRRERPHCAKRKTTGPYIRKRDTCHPFTNTYLGTSSYQNSKCTGTCPPLFFTQNRRQLPNPACPTDPTQPCSTVHT